VLLQVAAKGAARGSAFA
jgi:mono/diheme cytochrome c family protein